ncbi:DUF3800 domain-containing protein [Paracoccus albus]|uniref:DUF3800 domain-containing protein n=1 Tax=Paracoccus albus TaxID=3017784 RepID=UPI0022F0FFF1|nr:DUF3800 domain-containing protein [Paracoccus albus]WBU61388.1 DUF3800 domain-containing protein [Paracoccus albus]
MRVKGSVAENPIALNAGIISTRPTVIATDSMLDISTEAAPTLYVFLDEGGNFDFSPSGSEYFTLTSVSMMRPFRLHTFLDTYKYDLLEFRVPPRIDLEYFHCAEDNSHIKERVFQMLADNLPLACADAVVVEKRKTGPALQAPENFYPRMLGYLLRYVVERCPNGIGELVIITDSIPVNRKRRAIEKAVKVTLSQMLPDSTPYRLMHHRSKAHYGLQIADYINWAILRKWERKQLQHHSLIEPLIRSEFDIFRTGRRHYY